MGYDWGSNELFNTHGNLSWGSKVCQIRSYGTSNMLVITCFKRVFVIFRIFFTPKNTIFPQIFLRELFSIKQDIFLILKLWITFLKELVVSQGSFLAKCTGLYSIHTDVMSGVVLENTRDIKCIFQTSRFIKFILFWAFIYFFFLLLNYQNMATDKILQFE